MEVCIYKAHHKADAIEIYIRQGSIFSSILFIFVRETLCACFA